MKLSLTPNGYVVFPDEYLFRRVRRSMRLLGPAVSIAVIIFLSAIFFYEMSSLWGKLIAVIFFLFSMYIFINFFTDSGIKKRFLKNGILTTGKILELLGFSDWTMGIVPLRVDLFTIGKVTAMDTLVHISYQDEQGTTHNEWVVCSYKVVDHFELAPEKKYKFTL